MKYSEMSLKILAARELGIIKTNAQFWKDFSDSTQLAEKLQNNPHIENVMERLSIDFDLADNEDGVICAFDNEFPVINHNVKNNGDKPYLLFYKGDLSSLAELNRNVAVIGLLDPDDDIVKRETKIVEELIAMGTDSHKELIIVSGLAVGCDTIAHKVCLENSGKTIAILPTQINKIYPVVNRDLAKAIVDKGGLLLSEYYKEPLSRNESLKRLVDRDRLQAMFAKAIILIASYRKGEGDSGSRHAMEAAKKYGLMRYVMYNPQTDEKNIRFGLNKDFVYSKAKEENVEVLVAKSIKDISALTNHNLEKKRSTFCVQQTLDFNQPARF